MITEAKDFYGRIKLGRDEAGAVHHTCRISITISIPNKLFMMNQIKIDDLRRIIDWTV